MDGRRGHPKDQSKSLEENLLRTHTHIPMKSAVGPQQHLLKLRTQNIKMERGVGRERKNVVGSMQLWSFSKDFD